MENVVRVKRNGLGLSQSELGERVEVSRKTISQIESGKQAPSVVTALRLGSVMDCSVEDLFRIEE